MISQSCPYHSFYFIMSSVALVIKVLWYKSHYRVNEDWKAARIALGCHHLLGGCKPISAVLWNRSWALVGWGGNAWIQIDSCYKLAGHRLSQVFHILQSLFLKLCFPIYIWFDFFFGVLVIYTMFGFVLSGSWWCALERQGRPACSSPQLACMSLDSTVCKETKAHEDRNSLPGIPSPCEYSQVPSIASHCINLIPTTGAE